MSYDSWTEKSDKHALRVEEFWMDAEGIHYSLEVIHPPDCLPVERIVTTESSFSWPDYRCWIGHEVAAVGLKELLANWEYPIDDGFDWLVMASVLTGKDIPIKYSAGGGYDYWGEYDEDYEIELIT